MLEDQKEEIQENRVKIDQIKVDLVDEVTMYKEIEYLNKIEYEKLEIKFGELTKKVKKKLKF